MNEELEQKYIKQIAILRDIITDRDLYMLELHDVIKMIKNERDAK